MLSNDLFITSARDHKTTAERGDIRRMEYEYLRAWGGCVEKKIHPAISNSECLRSSKTNYALCINIFICRA